ncbi:LOW QUALITY PROTEIN: Yokozuna, partial [Phytophthora megakarya]
MEDAHGVRAMIGEECNDKPAFQEELLPAVDKTGDLPSDLHSASLVGGVLLLARCTRPDIAFSVHKATRQTHQRRLGDWKLCKRVLHFLSDSKNVKLCIKDCESSTASHLEGFSDADFAADKTDRKSVRGGSLSVQKA